MDRKFYREYIAFTVILLAIVLGSVIIISHSFKQTSTKLNYECRTFLIDAGHGGEDGGAVSISGIPESKYNLQFATCINDLLQLLGYKTYMLRTDDRDLHTEGTTISQRKISDLKQRVSIINSFQNATLISVHQNYFTDARYSGLQSFYFTQDSRDLAESIQLSYKTHIEPSSRRLAQRKKGIYLLEHVQCNAVLVECGFLSNREEEKRLNDKSYQLKLSAIIIMPLIKHPCS